MVKKVGTETLMVTFSPVSTEETSYEIPTEMALLFQFIFAKKKKIKKNLPLKGQWY